MCNRTAERTGAGWSRDGAAASAREARVGRETPSEAKPTPGLEPGTPSLRESEGAVRSYSVSFGMALRSADLVPPVSVAFTEDVHPQVHPRALAEPVVLNLEIRRDRVGVEFLGPGAVPSHML